MILHLLSSHLMQNAGKEQGPFLMALRLFGQKEALLFQNHGTRQHKLHPSTTKEWARLWLNEGKEDKDRPSYRLLHSNTYMLIRGKPTAVC